MSIPKRIFCHDEFDRPVPSTVLFETRDRSISVETAEDGSVQCPWFCDKDTFVSISPKRSYWSTALLVSSMPNSDDIAINLEPLDFYTHALWWLRIFEDVIGTDCSNIRIGIADLGFSATSAICKKDEPIRGSGTPDSPLESHGYFVSQVFNTWREAGALLGADFQFFDVGLPFPAVEEIDPQAVMFAVISLRDDFDADLINISSGYDLDEFAGTVFEDDSREWSRLFQYEISQCRGLVVAAAGNDTRSGKVLAPAAFDEAVGVTGVGATSAVIEGTSLDIVYRTARIRQDYGPEILGQQFFHVDGASYGEEIDAAGPSVGIWLRCADGLLKELSGTSFAAPNVTAALACAISSRKGNNRNYVVSKDILSEVCVDVGLIKTKQGDGIPLKP